MALEVRKAPEVVNEILEGGLVEIYNWQDYI